MTNQADNSILRWGGLASIAGGILFIGVFAWVITMAGADPAGLAGPITKFPEIQWIRTVENGAYLIVLVLWVPVYLALYRALRHTSPAGALFGSSISILGVGVLAAGAIPHIATTRLSDLYHAKAVTPEEKAALLMTWQGVQGIFDALLVTGMLLMAIGIVVIGAAMHIGRPLGTGIAAVTVLLGIATLAAGIAMLIDPASLAAALGMFALIGFHLAVGWKVNRLPKTA